MSKHLSSSRRARGLVASFAAVALGVTGLVALATSASAAVAPCVPQDAWTETVPAQGTPTIEIDNPDYVPASTIEHPEQTEDYNVWIYSKWTPGQGWRYKEFPQTAKPADPGQGWIFWKLEVRTRVVTEAWTETIPAVGTPKITVANPAYVPERVIEHQAVVCPVTEWHTWQTSLKPGVTTPVNGSHVTWPQAYVGAGKIAPTQCGVWYQQDLYKGTSSAIAALYADGLLTELAPGVYEDAALVAAAGYQWKFIYGGDCVDEQPEEVPVDPAVFTAPTCDAPGTLVGVDTEYYEWVESGFPSEATLTAEEIGEVILTGQTVFGPHDLTQLTGAACLSETPVIPQTPVVPTAPVVTQATLAETGFPLLGVLGLAGSFSLIGGGLVNARRLLRKSA